MAALVGQLLALLQRARERHHEPAIGGADHRRAADVN